MMERGRVALSLGFILVLVAFGGWGAFAHSLYSAREQERALRNEVTRVTVERGRLGAELARVWRDYERTLRELEQAQADLVSVRAEAAALAVMQGRKRPPP